MISSANESIIKYSVFFFTEKVIRFLYKGQYKAIYFLSRKIRYFNDVFTS